MHYPKVPLNGWSNGAWGIYLPWITTLVGLSILYGPTFHGLLTSIWATDEQGHGPLVLGLACWLIWRKRKELITPVEAPPATTPAWIVLLFSAMLYAIGRSQDILIFEVGSLIGMVAGIVLLLQGTKKLRTIWFALFFMLFMVPLPSSLVDLLTQPMKMAVSYAATNILDLAGYPIARSGVIITIGQYQLLVADACAGLHTLFTLEAIGLLYLNIVRSTSAARNILLAIFIVPISFSANVIRVIILTLITYHFGDEAGQGFIHGFAGMVLFLSALVLIIAVDGVLKFSLDRWSR